VSTVKHAVIAAAGLGSRLGMGKPKCLIEFSGTTILEHQLGLLRNVEDVRVVVGFEEERVTTLVKEIRPDVIIVRNPAYRTTTTLHSYAMGAEYLKENCLFMDGDILFQPSSFTSFLSVCEVNETLIGITKAKTKDAVYALTNEESEIESFSRVTSTPYEWANIVWIAPNKFEYPTATSVYERLTAHLPLRTKEIVSYEIDTKEDMDNAIINLSLFGLKL
jgi:choline kinase